MFLSTAVRIELDQTDRYLMEFGSKWNKQTEMTQSRVSKALIDDHGSGRMHQAQICWKQKFAQSSKTWIYYVPKWYLVKEVLQMI